MSVRVFPAGVEGCAVTNVFSGGDAIPVLSCGFPGAHSTYSQCQKSCGVFTHGAVIRFSFTRVSLSSI